MLHLGVYNTCVHIKVFTRHITIVYVNVVIEGREERERREREERREEREERGSGGRTKRRERERG